MTLDALEATPWVQRTLRTVWDRVAAQVPESWMPKSRDRASQVFEEFGCGHYGCVMPTNEPGLVCKLTSDISEARFVARAMTLPPHDGIVEYKGLYALRGEERSVGWGNKRPMFILWRAEAFHVGLLSQARFYPNDPMLRAYFKAPEDPYTRRMVQEGDTLLRRFQREAAVVRKYLKPRLQTASNKEQLLSKVWQAFESSPPEDPDLRSAHWAKGLQRVGIAINNCWHDAQMIQSTPYVDPVGGALAHYLNEGLLLADVHLNNIGVSQDNALIITDPGHAIEIHPRWAGPVNVTEI